MTDALLPPIQCQRPATLLEVLAMYRSSIETQRVKLGEAYGHLLQQIDTSMRGLHAELQMAPDNPSTSTAIWHHLEDLLQDAKRMGKLTTKNIPAHFQSSAALVATAVLQYDKQLEAHQRVAAVGVSDTRARSSTVRIAHTILASATPALSSSPIARQQPLTQETFLAGGPQQQTPGVGAVDKDQQRNRFRFVMFLAPHQDEVQEMCACLDPPPPRHLSAEAHVSPLDPVPLVAAFVSRVRVPVAVLHASVLMDLVKLVSTLTGSTSCVTEENCASAIQLGNSFFEGCGIGRSDSSVSSTATAGKRVAVLPLEPRSPVVTAIRHFHLACQVATGVRPQERAVPRSHVDMSDDVEVVAHMASRLRHFGDICHILSSICGRVARLLQFTTMNVIARQIGMATSHIDPQPAIGGGKFQVVLGSTFPSKQRSDATLPPAAKLHSMASSPMSSTTPIKVLQPQPSLIDDDLLFSILLEIEGTADVVGSKAWAPTPAPERSSPLDLQRDDKRRKRSRSPSTTPAHADAAATVTLRRRRSRSLLPARHDVGDDDGDGWRRNDQDESQDVQFDPLDDDNDGDAERGGHRHVTPADEQGCDSVKQQNDCDHPPTIEFPHTSPRGVVKPFLTFQMTNSIRDKRRDLQQLLTTTPTLSQAPFQIQLKDEEDNDGDTSLPLGGGADPPSAIIIGAYGKLETASYYIPAADILVVADGVMERTEKYLSFCASGKPIVSPRYIVDSVARGVWLPLDAHHNVSNMSRRRALEYELSPPRRRWLQDTSVRPPNVVVERAHGEVHTVWVPSVGGTTCAQPVSRPFEHWRVVLFASKQVSKGIQSILAAGGCACVISDPNPPDAKHWKARDAPAIVSTLPCGALTDDGLRNDDGSSGALAATAATEAGATLPAANDDLVELPKWLADYIVPSGGTTAPQATRTVLCDDDASSCDVPVSVHTSDLVRAFTANIDGINRITHVLVEGPLVGDAFVAPQQLPLCFVRDGEPAAGHDTDGPKQAVFSLELLHHVLCVASLEEFDWPRGALTAKGEAQLPAVCRLSPQQI